MAMTEWGGGYRIRKSLQQDGKFSYQCEQLVSTWFGLGKKWKPLFWRCGYPDAEETMVKAKSRLNNYIKAYYRKDTFVY